MALYNPTLPARLGDTAVLGKEASGALLIEAMLALVALDEVVEAAFSAGIDAALSPHRAPPMHDFPPLARKHWYEEWLKNFTPPTLSQETK